MLSARSKEVFDRRDIDAFGNEGDWFRQKLPHYDDAYTYDIPIRPSFISEDSATPHGAYRRKTEDIGQRLRSQAAGRVKVDEKALRHGFLAFFVAVLKNYRRYLVYASRERPSPLAAFRNEAFIADHPTNWQPFLITLVHSQAFSQFVDERVGRLQAGEQKGFQSNDVVFFDESIDAKMNRYSFALTLNDTPFLSSTADVHAKSYVPPSPDSTGIEPDSLFSYDRFPSLRIENFATNNGVKINRAFENTAKGQALAAAASQARLKRVNSGAPVDDLTIASCHFSSYLTVLAYRIVQSPAPTPPPAKANVFEIEKHIAVFHGSPRKSDPDKTFIDLSKSSSYDLSKDGNTSPLSSRVNPLPAISAVDEARLLSARKLALKVALECLNCLTKMNDSPDEISFRLVDIMSSSSIVYVFLGTSLMPARNAASHAAQSR